MSLPSILTSTEQVAEFAVELEKHPVIAVDLEADSMHNYQEKVCLLQFSTTETTVLIDPLAGADLAPLRPVLANPQVRKIFHAADYDMRCLARDFDIKIDGLFDTMISSQFLGEEKFGLADVLRKYFAVELDKQYQRADWSKRPLSEGMIRYAAEDTCHLHRLVEILEQQLIDKGRFKGAGTLDKRQLAVLENLLQWRDVEARRRDTPLYKVLGNKSLLHMAKLKPTGRSKLQEIDGLSPRLIERYGGKLLQQVEMALDLSEAELPNYPRGERRAKDPQVDKRMTRLKDWRKKIAAELELDPGVLINNALLEELARKQPKSEQALEEIKLLKKWQCKVLGEGILRSLS